MTNESELLPHDVVPRGRHYNSLQRDILRHHQHAWNETQKAGDLLLHGKLPDVGTLSHTEIEARLQDFQQGREVGLAADWPLLTVHGKWTPDGKPRPFVPDWVPENLQARQWGRIGTHRYTTDFDQVNSNTWCWVDFRNDTQHEMPLLAEQVTSAGMIQALPLFFKVTPVAMTLEDALSPFTGLIAKRPSTVHEGVQAVMDRFGMYVMMSTADMYGNALHGVMGVGYPNTRQPNPSFFWSVTYRTSVLTERLRPVTEPVLTRSYTGFTHTTVSPERTRLESSRPSIPENVQVVVDNNQVTLTWTYDAELIPINGWLVTIYIGGEKESYRYKNTDRTLSRTLPWGKFYTLHLQGWNRNGDGVPFINQSQITPNPGRVPGVISNLSATINVDALSFTLTWTAAAGTVTGYKIEYSSESNLLQTVETTETTLTVLNVERNVYYARVAAINDDGAGDWSEKIVLDINIGSVLTDVPSTVINLQQDFDATTDSQIVWTWTLPTGAFDSIRVNTGPNGTTGWNTEAEQILLPTATSYTWRGNGVQFIRVAPKNAKGYAAWVIVSGISHQPQKTYHQRLDVRVYANSELSPTSTLRPKITGVGADQIRAWAHSLSYNIDTRRHIVRVDNFRIGNKNAVTNYRPPSSMSGGRALASNAVVNSDWRLSGRTGRMSFDTGSELRSMTPYYQEGGIVLTMAFKRTGNKVTPYLLLHALHIGGLRPTILPYSVRSQANHLPGHGVAAASFFDDRDNVSRSVHYINDSDVTGNRFEIDVVTRPLSDVPRYSDGLLVSFEARYTSDRPVSIQVSERGLRELYFENGDRVGSGHIQQGDQYLVEYYNRKFYLVISDQSRSSGNVNTYGGIGQAALSEGRIPGASSSALAFHTSALCGPPGGDNRIGTIELGGTGTHSRSPTTMSSNPVWRDNRWWVDDAGISTLTSFWGDAGASRLPSIVPVGYRPTQNVKIMPSSPVTLSKILAFRRSRAWLGVKGNPGSSDIGVPRGKQMSYFIDSKAGRDLFGWDQWTDFPISPGNLNITGILNATGTVSFSRIWLTQVPNKTWYTSYENPTAEADTIDTYVINNYQCGDSRATGASDRKIQPDLFAGSVIMAPNLESTTDRRYPLNERIVLFPKTTDGELQTTKAVNKLFVYDEIELQSYTTTDPQPT